jgi:hypothetical protein
VACDTTGRAAMALGGGVAVGAPAFAPSTLVFAGATAAAFTTDAFFISLGGTVTAAFATGSEFVMVRVGTAVTAPATFWFA